MYLLRVKYIQNIEWKCPETSNSYILNCASSCIAWWNFTENVSHLLVGYLQLHTLAKQFLLSTWRSGPLSQHHRAVAERLLTWHNCGPKMPEEWCWEQSISFWSDKATVLHLSKRLCVSEVHNYSIDAWLLSCLIYEWNHSYVSIWENNIYFSSEVLLALWNMLLTRKKYCIGTFAIEMKPNYQ